MAIIVCDGALCRCSFGAAPCRLTVSSNTSVLGQNKPLATVMDSGPANLAGFGMCSSMANPAVSAATSAALGVLTPQPCTPVPAGPWMPGSQALLVQNKPALTGQSKLICAYGGVIEIAYPGQEMVQVP